MEPGRTVTFSNGATPAVPACRPPPALCRRNTPAASATTDATEPPAHAECVELPAPALAELVGLRTRPLTARRSHPVKCAAGRRPRSRSDSDVAALSGDGRAGEPCFTGDPRRHAEPHHPRSSLGHVPVMCWSGYSGIVWRDGGRPGNVTSLHIRCRQIGHVPDGGAALSDPGLGEAKKPERVRPSKRGAQARTGRAWHAIEHGRKSVFRSRLSNIAVNQGEFLWVSGLQECFSPRPWRSV